jgi:hypothetical protein
MILCLSNFHLHPCKTFPLKAYFFHIVVFEQDVDAIISTLKPKQGSGAGFDK